MSRFREQSEQLQARRDEEREADRDKVKARIAARKRMREQLGKDEAVSKELDRITKTHVSLVLRGISYKGNYVNKCLCK